MLSDFKDIEKKLGRNVPESLIRSLAGGHHHHDKHEERKPATPKNRSNSADLKRLESKILFLKQEMVGYVVCLKDAISNICPSVAVGSVSCFVQ